MKKQQVFTELKAELEDAGIPVTRERSPKGAIKLDRQLSGMGSRSNEWNKYYFAGMTEALITDGLRCETDHCRIIKASFVVFVNVPEVGAPTSPEITKAHLWENISEDGARIVRDAISLTNPWHQIRGRYSQEARQQRKLAQC